MIIKRGLFPLNRQWNINSPFKFLKMWVKSKKIDAVFNDCSILAIEVTTLWDLFTMLLQHYEAIATCIIVK